MTGTPRPAHHLPDGRFRNPWPEAAGDAILRTRIRRVAWQWLTTSLPPDPDPADLPVVESDPARPTAGEGETRITWVGHSTFLLQLPGLNLLTDPVWSERVSPVPFLGARRFVPASPPLDRLPPVHAVVISHDHFDHLDRRTVRKLHERFGDGLRWFTPLGYRGWFEALGVDAVTELDWWETAVHEPSGYRMVATPARHWTRRTLLGTDRRLWCSWAVRPRAGDGPAVYVAGDSGYVSGFAEIGERLGPFDASLIPVGAYEPRWFMRASHMNPEEAVRTYLDLGGHGAFVPTHWGTFRLTFEDPLEPPVRLREAWRAVGLATTEDLRIPRHGETLVV